MKQLVNSLGMAIIIFLLLATTSCSKKGDGVLPDPTETIVVPSVLASSQAENIPVFWDENASVSVSIKDADEVIFKRDGIAWTPSDFQLRSVNGNVNIADIRGETTIEISVKNIKFKTEASVKLTLKSYSKNRSYLCLGSYQWGNYRSEVFRIDNAGNPISAASPVPKDMNKHIFYPNGTGTAITPSGTTNQTYSMQGSDESEFVSGPLDIWIIDELAILPVRRWIMHQDRIDSVTGYTFRTVVYYG